MSSTRDAPVGRYSPHLNRMRTVIGSHPIIEQEPEGRHQSPQPTSIAVARTTHLSAPNPTPTPTPTPPPQMRRTTNKSPKPKERLLKYQPPQEQVNYPCHEPLSDFHRQQLYNMELYPSDGVSRYTRRIPFKGSKGAFFETTGRSQFDVYEYRFTAPNVFGERKHWWIMWDYYNGLVRVHDFFDCCKPGKTEPGNALKDKVNPGLINLCPNITGGNLHAQGYWFPFEAAKALAAKFCYKIRYALTIIFGDDFPSICLPEDHDDFGKYNIDPAIIARCQRRAEEQKQSELERRNQDGHVDETFTPGPRYATPADTTPARSNFHTASPEMAATSRDHTTRYFDPVRDDYTNTAAQLPELPSPGNMWTPARQHHSSPHGQERQLGYPPYYQFVQDVGSDSHSRILDSRQYHPYAGYAIGRSILRNSPYSQNELQGPPQALFRAPPENLTPKDPSHVSRPQLPFQHPPMGNPGFYHTVHHPIARSTQDTGYGGYRYPTISTIPQRRELPLPQQEAETEHYLKKRRISGQLSPRASPEYCPQPFELGLDPIDPFMTMAAGTTIPAPVDSYARSPMQPRYVNRESEKSEVQEAAKGLMNLRKKDTELELEGYRRRNSA